MKDPAEGCRVSVRTFPAQAGMNRSIFYYRRKLKGLMQTKNLGYIPSSKGVLSEVKYGITRIYFQHYRD
jgi:hypothetical protein